MSNTVDIPVTVKDAIRKFRFRSNKVSQDVALVIKIDKTKLEMKVEEELEGTVEEIAEELPENGPRFIVLSHPLTHKDGRLSSPLILINWIPPNCPPDLLMLHSSSLQPFQSIAECGKVLDVRDGAEALTKEWVDRMLLA